MKNIAYILPVCSALFLLPLAPGCDDADDAEDKDADVDTDADVATDAAVDVATDAPTGLPTEFGDCSSPPCQVALEAFYKNGEKTTPYCPQTQPTPVALKTKWCGSTTKDVTEGKCGGITVYRMTYAFTGDFFECHYDASTGMLAGARWTPDNHPQQVAGTGASLQCNGVSICSAPDGGTDTMAGDAGTDAN